jgi:hypothetical protein
MKRLFFLTLVLTWFAATATATATVAAHADQQPQLRPGYGRTVLVSCASNDYRPINCFAGGYIVEAQVHSQQSRYPCIYGQSWGYQGDSVWVARGCRATFRVVVQSQGGGSYIMDCASNSHRYQRCGSYSPIQFARLFRQVSDSPCIEGRTWGYDYNSIWVSNGCRGSFEVFSN